ncbi:MAG: sigma-70 family RNA polymerase sigma factor [Gammaproteobacteria bacterium]|nr:sigma-70 family RNA polymerase sigma factor [Gammaproteobacteria bacterium]
MSDAHRLLREYAEGGSEEAFAEVVRRYLDLVYSTALRLVNGDQHQAEDVSQKVFADLASVAARMKGEVMLGGWLHRHTCFVASKTMRAERRRQIREREAVEMKAMQEEASADLALVSPVLDEAINQLGSADRQAILLRFFEHRDYAGVGAGLGSNEEAARKRVGRALEKLERLLKRRGIALSATALGTALGTGAVSAAPAGLSASIAASAVAAVTLGGGGTLAFLTIMNITKTQVAVFGAVVLTLGVPLIMQKQAQAKLQAENEGLKQQVADLSRLKAENDRLSNLVAEARQAPTPATNEQFRELMKLRGQVGTLRQTAEEAVAAAAAKSDPPSVMSGLTQNPEMVKMIRDQQKMALGMVYKGLATKANLSPDLTENLNNLLADHVMTNINYLTTMLRDGKSMAEMDQVFSAQETELKKEVKQLLGPEDFQKYEDYTRNLASYLTSEQFKGMLTGDKEAKEAQTKQMYQLMQEETDRALAAAGLPKDYQTVPTLNFRNIASEEFADKNLNLLDSIYANVANRAGAFLSPEELEKFAEFRKMAINNNRVALTVNRKVMAPPNK